MASTEVLGETRAGLTDDEQERDVLESETISSGGTPDELISAMTQTVATQLLDAQDTDPGGEHAVTHADEPATHARAPEPGAATEIRVFNTGEPDDRSGDTIHDRYQLVRQLGKGGMGTVYTARHTALPKTFAVKVLNGRYAKRKDIAERFLQEARAVSLIEHENVVGVIDFGREHDGTAFLVMEHLRGESLSAVCKREAPLAWPRVRHIMDQLCRALQAAHDVGIIHRDVKPENVIRVGRHGDPDFIKILDFGLAKLQVAGGLRLTQTGMVLGTPDYMSPEQARGRPTDHRADIYASGVMMYELLSGRVPFKARTFQAMRQKHLLEPPDPPSQKAPDAAISPEIDAIVLRALAKQPDNRFASMADMARAITAAGTPDAKPIPLAERGTMPLLAERGLLDRPRRPSSDPTKRGLPPHTAALRPTASPGMTVPLLAKVAKGAAQPTHIPDPRPVSEPHPQVGERKRGVVTGLALAGLIAGLGGLVFVGGAWLAKRGPFAPPATVDATDPAPGAPHRPSSHATVRFETNVPVKVLDADGVARFGNVARPELLIPWSPQPLELILRAEGYRDLHVIVTPNADQTLRFELELAPPEPEPEQPETPDPDSVGARAHEQPHSPTAPVAGHPTPKRNKPGQPTPEQPKPEQPKPEQPEPEQPEPEQPVDDEPVDDEPVNDEPDPPVEPDPSEVPTSTDDDGESDGHSFAPEIVDPFGNKTE